MLIICLTFTYSRQDLQFLHLLSGRFLATLDSEFARYLTLSIIFFLYVIFCRFQVFYWIVTEKDVCFSVFSPKYSNFSSNSTANSFIIIVRSIV